MSAFGGKGDDNIHTSKQRYQSGWNREQSEQVGERIRIRGQKKAASGLLIKDLRVRYSPQPTPQKSVLVRNRVIAEKTLGYDGVIQRCGDFESSSKTISEDDRSKISKWVYKPRDELYLQYKSVFDNPKYYNQETGEIIWPPNDGFTSPPGNEKLISGTEIDRYGSDDGRFVSPKGTPYDERAVAPGTNLKPYSVFKVVKEFFVKSGTIAPWFDKPGGGTQYKLPKAVKDLLDTNLMRIEEQQ